MSDDLPKYILGIASLIIIIFVAINTFFIHSKKANPENREHKRGTAGQKLKPKTLQKSFYYFPYADADDNDDDNTSEKSSSPSSPSSSEKQKSLTITNLPIDDDYAQESHDPLTVEQGGSNKEKYKKLKNIIKISHNI